METQSRRQMEQKLEAIEARLKKKPSDIELQFERASLLTTLGQIEQAKVAYIEILKQTPTHFATLNNLAVMLDENNLHAAARVLFVEGIKHHPEKPLIHINFGNMLLYAGEFAEARERYETALRLDPDNIRAHQGLSLLLQELGEEEQMQYHRIKGYGNQPVTKFPYLGNGEPIPLLLLTSAMGGGDLPWRKVIDNKVFLITTVTAEFFDPALPLPPHKLIFNTIGDADTCQSDLKAAEDLVKNATAPVINSPSAVIPTGRVSNADRLRHLPGVITPHSMVLPREALGNKSEVEALLVQHELSFPLLLRSPGFHTGKYFVYVDNIDALISMALTLPGKWLMVLEYLDARGHDKLARKYRVMMINGNLYPLHLAISGDWKVHYFNAEMTNNALHQAEEAEFLNNMPTVLGEKVMGALHSIQATMGLDYGGIDFGIDKDANLLLFEANATMNIIPPNADKQWDYRREPINNALLAVTEMLRSRAYE